MNNGALSLIELFNNLKANSVCRQMKLADKQCLSKCNMLPKQARIRRHNLDALKLANVYIITVFGGYQHGANINPQLHLRLSPI